MATQSVQFYTNSDGSTAALVFDDVAMTASGVLVHVPQGARAVQVQAVISGQPVELNYGPGTDTTFSFSQALPISFITAPNGGQGIDMPWFGSFTVAVNG